MAQTLTEQRTDQCNASEAIRGHQDRRLGGRVQSEQGVCLQVLILRVLPAGIEVLTKYDTSRDAWTSQGAVDSHPKKPV